MLEEKINFQSAGNLLTILLLLLVVFQAIGLSQLGSVETAMTRQSEIYQSVVLALAGLGLMLTRLRIGAVDRPWVIRVARVLMWPLALLLIYFAGVNFMGQSTMEKVVLAPGALFMALLAIRLAGRGEIADDAEETEGKEE